MARFGTANEHADWETALHVFTYANAIHQALKRIGADDGEQNGGIEAARGVLHGAMAVYLARYLNVPPARLPGEDGDRLDDLPDDIEDIRAALLGAFDRQRQVDSAGRLVARHLTLGHPPDALIATLAQALLREDAGFHAYQMLEAGVRQFGEWGNTDPGRHILIAVARYLAAHSPTERAVFQTADIAQRLLRGGELHQDQLNATGVVRVRVWGRVTIARAWHISGAPLSYFNRRRSGTPSALRSSRLCRHALSRPCRSRSAAPPDTAALLNRAERGATVKLLLASTS